ncbi:alpha/beta hydrolase [Streptacidiphilus sp. 4-A2]|nr:alpha/beta hydrolase [Streptacidiphilus sp. 4-A2]
MSDAFPDPARAPLTAEALRAAARTGAAPGPSAAPHAGPGTSSRLPPLVVRDRLAPGDPPVPVRIYRSEGAAHGGPTVVFLHGGGWVMCDLDTHDSLCRALVALTGLTVVGVDYRRAPEHPFPAALLDTCAVISWAARWSSRLAVAGDSSGGNLAAAATLMCRDRGGPGPAAQLLLYPVLDHRLDRPSASAYATGFFHTTAHMRWYWQQYLGPDGEGDHPYASPGLAPDLAGLPPVCLLLPECDPLRDEGHAYAERLAGSGVPVRLTVAPGMFHGFLGLRGLLPQADDHLADAAAWLTRTLRQ